MQQIFESSIDPAGNRAPLEDAVGQEIPVTIFDSVAPEGMELTSIGNDFCEQVSIASRLIELLGDECGEVAIMMGVPTAPTLCPQELTLFPHMSVAENLFLPYSRSGGRDSVRFGIAAEPSDLVRTISVSDRQLLQIARAPQIRR